MLPPLILKKNKQENEEYRYDAGTARIPVRRYVTGNIEPTTILYVFLFHILIFCLSHSLFLLSPRGRGLG